MLALHLASLEAAPAGERSVAILPKKNKKLPLDAPGWWFM
jgi:hypothetical protein